MGDPCGIGPEIVVAQWLRQPRLPAVVVGSVAVIRRALTVLAAAGWPVQGLTVQGWDPQSGEVPGTDVIPVWEPEGLPQGLEALPWGQVSAQAGQAAACCVRAAADLVQRARARAVVTAPLHKEALSAAGEPFPGHTELLQALATPDGQPLVPVRMMLANHELKTVLVSIHVSLRQAIEAVTIDNVLQTLKITHDSLRRMGIDRPRIAVAGLNPHAGEGGLFGDEEIHTIIPAIDAARAQGLDVSGPWPPDTVFMRARHAPPEHPGEFDVVVAMYHDQGLIPVKYLGVAKGVNVTLGLPFVRTSPDHGTAFDLAGQGRADPSSLSEAMQVALQLSAAAPA
ncbi:MAG TPA: 4-hydroxythreonine-4-phosphate dehydrogenase PdxA [Aquabacterium sp.]|nr:4-hydroxythreonine-4-phosphate dehydrogenase PdxA [Aquabacterium sp.]HEX5372761.1 4-hydroxythreonine-4-phosphate dehydrogenase PdxA [Aquabacterium sp.]